MRELSKKLHNYFFNRTIRAACSFQEANYCGDFEPRDVVSVLRKNFRARVKELRVSNERFGRPAEGTGNFDGFLGDVQKGVYDVALAHLGIVEERFRVLGFTRPYSIEAVRFAVREGEFRPITPALVKPFKADLWLALLFLSIICTTYMVYEARLAHFKTSLSRILFLLLEVFLQKSSSHLPSAFRRPVILWALLTIILANWYNATIQSFLTSPGRVPVISTLEDLAQALETDPDLKICLHREGFAEHVIETAGSALLQEVRARLHSDPNGRSQLSDCLTRLCSGRENLVTVVEGVRIQPAADAVLNDPRVQVSQDQFGIIAIAAAASKNSESLLYVDRLIGVLFESGIFQRTILSRRKDFPSGSGSSTRGFGVLVLSKIAAIGYLASVTALIIEVASSWPRAGQSLRPSPKDSKRHRFKDPYMSSDR